MSSAHTYRVTKTAQRTPICDTCKSRHQKCSGEKPQCSNCKLRGISCVYSTTKTRVPEISRSPETTFATPLSRPSISDADYERLYSEIFGDIVRRLNLSRDSASAPHEDALLDARPGNASLPSLNREVFSIVREQISRESGPSTSQSNATPIREPALERSPDHIRKILRDSLPSQDVSLHLLDLFLDHQNSIFYAYRREEARAQLALMYDQPASVSIAWFCQMFLIFAVGVQFDEIYDTDGATYHEIGQKHIDDAIDENPHSTVWVIRAMLLLCFYQTPTKWNSVWMHLDAAIRGAQRFQLDMGQNLLKELPDDEYQEWRLLWLTVISFDRWVAIFLGRLPRIKESISRDPIFKDPHFRLENTPQNNVTALAIISGNILRDMYFLENPSLNICHQRKSELENWMSTLTNPLRQQIESGNVPEFPKDQAEAIFNLHFMYLGSWTLLTRPFLLRALKMKTSSNLGGPIVSVISSEANLCIEYASRLINSATLLLGSSLAPKRSIMPVFFLINAAYIMILAAVWKLKQNGGIYGLPMTYGQTHELTAIDASIQILEFCGQRNSFARSYLIQIKDLRRQITLITSSEGSPSSGPFVSSAMSSSASVTDSDPVAESPGFQNLAISSEQSSRPSLGVSRMFSESGSYSSASPSNVNVEGWPSGQFGALTAGNEGSAYDSTSSFLFSPDEYNTGNFWDGVGK